MGHVGLKTFCSLFDQTFFEELYMPSPDLIIENEQKWDES